MALTGLREKLIGAIELKKAYISVLLKYVVLLTLLNISASCLLRFFSVKVK